MASIGLRVKTGKAMAVAIAGLQSAPLPILREEVALADRSDGNTVHPYHLEIEGHPESGRGSGAYCQTHRCRRTEAPL
jgi:hypothetical protein